MGARLLPLIDGQLVLDRVQLDGLNVRLQRDAAGQGNWAALLARLNRPAGASTTSLREFGGLSLRNSSVQYRDASGSIFALTNWRVETGAMIPQQPFSVETSFDLGGAGAGAAASAGGGVAIVFRSRVAAYKDRLNLTDVAAELRLQSPGVPAAGGRVRLSAPQLQADWSTPIQSWTAPEASLQSGAAIMQWHRAQLRLVSDAPPQASADFDLRPTSLRTLLESLGVQVPRTRDPNALARFSATGKLTCCGAGVALDQLALQLDDSHFTGRIADLAPSKVMEFQLHGDSLQLDRYRKPANEHSEPFVFPNAQLAALRARGTLSLDQAQMAGADFRGVTLQLLFADGSLGTTP